MMLNSKVAAFDWLSRTSSALQANQPCAACCLATIVVPIYIGNALDTAIRVLTNRHLCWNSACQIP